MEIKQHQNRKLTKNKKYNLWPLKFKSFIDGKNMQNNRYHNTHIRGFVLCHRLGKFKINLYYC